MQTKTTHIIRMIVDMMLTVLCCFYGYSSDRRCAARMGRDSHDGNSCACNSSLNRRNLKSALLTTAN